MDWKILYPSEYLDYVRNCRSRELACYRPVDSGRVVLRRHRAIREFDRIVEIPATTQRLVEGDQVDNDLGLGANQLVLLGKEVALGNQHIVEIGQAGVVLHEDQFNPFRGCCRRRLQVLNAYIAVLNVVNNSRESFTVGYLHYVHNFTYVITSRLSVCSARCACRFTHQPSAGHPNPVQGLHPPMNA